MTDDESEYQREINRLTKWCQYNNLAFNAFGRGRPRIHTPAFIDETRFGMLTNTFLNFSRSPVESALPSCITAQFGISNAQEPTRLQKLVNIAWFTRVLTPRTYRTHCLKKATCILPVNLLSATASLFTREAEVENRSSVSCQRTHHSQKIVAKTEEVVGGHISDSNITTDPVIYNSHLMFLVQAQSCTFGYIKLDNSMCVDDDECVGDYGTSLCGPSADCQNTEGSYNCTCKAGYLSKQLKVTDNRTCKDLINLCPKSSSVVDINSFAEVFTMSLSKLCKTRSTEFSKLVSNFLEIMENYTIASARNLHHQQKANFASNTLEIFMQAIRNSTIPKDNRSKLSTAKNSLDIGWETVAGKENFDVAAVVLISYKHLDSLMEPNLLEGSENEGKLGLISEVVTVTVTNTDRSHLLEPITLTFSNKKLGANNKRAKCVFWNSSALSWSTQGCQLVEFKVTYTVCSCTHLTSFAVLMALIEVEGNDAHNLCLITLVGVIVSLVCLAMSVLTFTLCRALKSIRTTIHTHLCISLFLAELLFIVGVDKTEYRTLCAVIAGFLHYFFLACFSWMLLEGVQLYLMVVKVFNAKSLRPTYMYLFGYGCPLITVGISAAVFSQGYGTEKYCWLDLKSGFLWAFLAPICVIILVNGGFFIITVLKLAEKFSSVNPDMGQLKNIRVFTFTAVAQLCLLGCTWIFGMLHFQKETIVMAYIFTVINSMQGMFIFILHCLLNKQVRDEYANFFLRFYRFKDSKYSEFSTSSTQGLRSTHETAM
ncbi:adhesion G protein-coupled receptor E3-like [Rhinoraja longicauda]